MVRVEVSSSYLGFLEELEIPHIVIARSIKGMHETEVPFWSDWLIDNAAFGNRMQEIYFDSGLPEYWSACRGYKPVFPADVFWLTIVWWIIRENPEIESKIESVMHIAGCEGLLTFIHSFYPF